MLLALIIYTRTPAHFRALALYRNEEYVRAGLPMLPVTHGERYTSLHVFLYTVLRPACTTLLPVAAGMAGLVYLLAWLPLNGYYLALSRRLLKKYSPALARKAFGGSIRYLALLFSARLLDKSFSALKVQKDFTNRR